MQIRKPSNKCEVILEIRPELITYTWIAYMDGVINIMNIPNANFVAERV